MEYVAKYIVQSAHGARLDAWGDLEFAATLEEARIMMSRYIALRVGPEDRGEEFEAEWEALADEAKTADVGDVLSFDERGWRIVEDGE